MHLPLGRRDGSATVTKVVPIVAAQPRPRRGFPEQRVAVVENGWRTLAGSAHCPGTAFVGGSSHTGIEQYRRP